MPAPAEETTLYIIAYDIPDDKRRAKVHRVLCGYGAWTQYSLFECWLNRRQILELRVKLARHLIAQRDSVRFYATRRRSFYEHVQNRAAKHGQKSRPALAETSAAFQSTKSACIA